MDKPQAEKPQELLIIDPPNELRFCGKFNKIRMFLF